MGAAKVTIHIIHQRLKKIYGNILTFDETTFTRVDKKCLFIDKDYGSWWALPNNVFNGHGHPKRGSKKTSDKIKYLRGLSLEELQKRIDTFNIGLRIKLETFVNSSTKCCFLDPIYGEWWATPSNVFFSKSKHPKRGVEQRKKTCIKKYGVDNPTKFKEIALRAAKNTNKIIEKFHWKTNESLLCVGSYEVKTVDWLNENKINFQWQPNNFVMPNGKTYRPDLLILDGIFSNFYIEIKGYFRDDAQEKWNWFQTEYPDNSILWDKNELQNLGILNKSTRVKNNVT